MNGNDRQCDKDKLAAYIRGDLDDRACQEVEAHAMECDACRTEIESSVGRVGKALRDAYPMVSPPERIHGRVMSAARARTKWRALGYVLAPAAAALAIWLLLPDRSAPVVPTVYASLSELQGAAIVRDQTVASGQALPAGERVFFVGHATVTADGFRARMDAALTVLTVGADEDPWSIEAGAVIFDEQPGSASVAVRMPDAAGTVLRPLGTRYRVEVFLGGDWMFAVYDGSVEQTPTSDPGLGPEVVPEGFKFDPVQRMQRLKANDAYGFMSLDAVLAPSPDGPLAVEQPASNRIDLPAEAVSQIARHLQRAYRRPNDPRPYIRAATVFEGLMERPAAATLVHMALKRDRALSAALDEELWALARGQAGAFGDAGTANRLFDILDQRGSETQEYRDAWRAIARAWTALTEVVDDEDRLREWRLAQGAVDAVLSAGQAADVLPIGSYLAVVHAVYSPWEGGYHLPTFDVAEDLLVQYQNNTPTNATPQQIATSYHRLNEAYWYLGRQEPSLRERSLEVLSEAIHYWPVPRWKVHLAERLVENGSRDRERVLALMRDGLRGDPSVYTYRKALGALYTLTITGENTEEDREAVKTACRWVAKAFPYVPEALDTASRILRDLGENEEAQRISVRASELREEDKRLEEAQKRSR